MKKAIDGLILRERPSGESDKLLTLLSAEEGRITVIAKGARSSRSKLLSVCQLYNYVNLEYYEKNELRFGSAGSVNENFFRISEDLEGASLAAYLSEITLEITGEGVPAPDILRMLLNCLYCIRENKKPRQQIKAVFELFAASVSGFSPDLSACAECGCVASEDAWLDVMNGRILCGECLRGHRTVDPTSEEDEYRARSILLPMDANALATMRYILSAPISRALSFRVNDRESMARLDRAAEVYLLNHLERSFSTLDFYRSVKKFDQGIN